MPVSAARAARGAGAPRRESTATRAPHASVWAVVPAKSFARAKSRLGASLDDDRRGEIARAMLDHVVDTAQACGAVDSVLVATDGDDVAGACADDVTILRDHADDTGRLGAIVDRALVALVGRGATVAVVLMGDLPHLAATDLVALIAALDTADLALAPDRADWGTNALAVRLPTSMPTAFGHTDSFARHLNAARRHGLATAVVRTPTLAYDVDAASDLPAASRRANGRS